MLGILNAYISESDVKGFVADIEKQTIDNTEYRKVLYTGDNSQLVVMSLKPQEEIGIEIHDVDQFFRFEKGKGEVTVNTEVYQVSDGSSVIVPANASHNIKNVGDEDLKFYTIYSPPHHKDGIEFQTKAEAEASDEEFDGQTTEAVKEFAIFKNLSKYIKEEDEDNAVIPFQEKIEDVGAEIEAINVEIRSLIGSHKIEDMYSADIINTANDENAKAGYALIYKDLENVKEQMKEVLSNTINLLSELTGETIGTDEEEQE